MSGFKLPWEEENIKPIVDAFKCRVMKIEVLGEVEPIGEEELENRISLTEDDDGEELQ